MLLVSDNLQIKFGIFGDILILRISFFCLDLPGLEPLTFVFVYRALNHCANLSTWKITDNLLIIRLLVDYQ